MPGFSDRRPESAYRRHVALLLLLISSAAAWADEVDLSIAAGMAPRALEQFSQQTQLQVLFRSEVVAAHATRAVHGHFAPAAALETLLAGSGLVFKFINNKTVVVDVPHANTKQAAEPRPPVSAPVPASAVAFGGDFGPPDWNDLDEVLITGSRRFRRSSEAIQEVDVYNRERIERSGATTLAGFLNTIPQTPLASTEATAGQSFGGSTTIRLHGLPNGTTLVLINGRRTETSGAQGFYDLFDLNNIPLGVVDRVEVLPTGSSAIYGSDAVAGVVNIILKNDYSGLAADTRYVWARGPNETDTTLSLGGSAAGWSGSLLATFQSRDPLLGMGRDRTATSNYRAFGAEDNNSLNCYPGNVFSLDGNNLPGLGAAYAGIPRGVGARPRIADFAATAGVLNECGWNAETAFLPATRRAGLLAQGSYRLSDRAEFFTELMYTHVVQDQAQLNNYLFGIQGFQYFTLGAQNPFNPFGSDVGLALELPNVPSADHLRSNFYRPLLGVRGKLGSQWSYEVSVRDTRELTHETYLNGRSYFNDAAAAAGLQAALNDPHPAGALDPFAVGTGANPAQFFSNLYNSYASHTETIEGLVRGSPFNLPPGPVSFIAGGEYDHTRFSYDAPGFATFDASRAAAAVYAETHIPLWSTSAGPGQYEVISIDAAARRDHYSDFGNKVTSQFGVQIHPLRAIALHAGYAEAFKAAGLAFLHLPRISTGANVVVDPLTGESVAVATTIGGNAQLQPMTGSARSLGIAYSGDQPRALTLSANLWKVDLTNSVQDFTVQQVLDYAGLFPGGVTRAPGLNGQPGVLTAVQSGYFNFGRISVAGLDYEVAYRFEWGPGDLSLGAQAVDTVRYLANLTPGAAATQRLSVASDDGNWAPRWKGTLSAVWSSPLVSLSLMGRYVGTYRDYDSPRTLGNFWVTDLNARFNLGAASEVSTEVVRGVFVEAGASNLFNRGLQFSNYGSALWGFDPTQNDLRGRVFYMRLGGRW
ncbi:MAG: TonB-dependent receptor [Proteobacteria bacterium]|nr:TonB-dependent receptor [Pseudomonadota bacterium]